MEQEHLQIQMDYVHPDAHERYEFPGNLREFMMFYLDAASPAKGVTRLYRGLIELWDSGRHEAVVDWLEWAKIVRQWPDDYEIPALIQWKRSETEIDREQTVIDMVWVNDWGKVHEYTCGPLGYLSTCATHLGRSSEPHRAWATSGWAPSTATGSRAKQPNTSSSR